MAKKVTKKKAVLKKSWKQIIAPPLFNSKVIGETYIADLEKSIGKKLTVSMMQVTGIPKQQNISVTLSMDSIKDDKIKTSIVGLKMSQHAVKRFMLKKREKIDESFLAKTKDGKKIRVKAVAVTKARTKGSVIAALHNALKANTIAIIAKTNYEELYNEILAKTIQKKISMSLKKIYPITVCELRWISLIPQKK